jgi:hypothetical protein
VRKATALHDGGGGAWEVPAMDDAERAVVEGRQRRPCEREHCVGEKEIKNKKENW